MAQHPSSLDWRSDSRTSGVSLLTAVLVLTLALSAAPVGRSAAATPINSATLDFVNVGKDLPVGRLTGFGPPEPQTHGGSWGGAPTPDFYRVVWFPGDQPLGVIELKIPPHSVAQKLEIDYLNGISGCFGSPLGDTFSVFAGNRPDPAEWAFIGTVVWDSSACTAGEQERAVLLYLRPANNQHLGVGGGSKGKDVFVGLLSAAGVANQPWASFTPFGQVGIHSVKLIGKVTNQGQ
jgi:hypothetical protein